MATKEKMEKNKKVGAATSNVEDYPTDKLQGLRSGRLTFIKVSRIEDGRVYLLLQCDCGNTCEVRRDNFVAGSKGNKAVGTKSCGCLAIEHGIEQGKKMIANLVKSSKERAKQRREREAREVA